MRVENYVTNERMTNMPTELPTSPAKHSTYYLLLPKY